MFIKNIELMFQYLSFVLKCSRVLGSVVNAQLQTGRLIDMSKYPSNTGSLQATTMDFELTLDKVLMHAEGVHGEQEILSCKPDGTIERYHFRDLAQRARKLAAALVEAGLKPGDRVASLMWNNSAHLEAYYAVPLAGGILHTVNVRFRPEEIAFVLNDAGSRFLIVDDNLLKLWGGAAPDCSIERIFVHAYEGEDAPEDGMESYDEFLNSANSVQLPELTDERAGATLCYTGGTTGRPKGVVYSHRALFLHALTEMSSSGFAYGVNDIVLPAVPMFHVNAWGIPYSTVMAGAKLILPGPSVSGASLLRLVEEEAVTFMAGVPTVWSNFLESLDELEEDCFMPDLRILTGGAAPHRTLIEGLDRYGIKIFQGWGMTETSGVLAVGQLKPNLGLTPESRTSVLIKQGLPLPIAQVRLVEDGSVSSDKGTRPVGAIEVRGTSVTGSYLHGLKPERWTEDGWLRTGDIGEIDEFGYLTVLEREEDLVKSGGEWIVPRDIEDVILESKWVEACAVVARPDIRWGERPVAFVVLSDDPSADWSGVKQALEARFPRYWLPDDFIPISALPYTSVGKIDRKKLKQRLLEK
ncbi:long-chain-fatty-acid--CoA ligase [Roseovarius sp. ZX-A-9]|uniref:long-chain-fatty-acid--CoA ligase n=1 Tax=Roseovarius sp. ZX-A-9 TaxID=3014783 RepID=UPI00232EABE4|nr:long-chain-fatty-acid--CoA ligase [Roseovarius sp. ZX-A-9]